ncbi:MAG: secretin and TonB N-terminal domain-containing protein, partial [Candidatus Omnitrophica bacterium]|nr:secretin and TonB N-terminal domain-containing protein [Candidatus Omnitrophota bacterium]
MLRILSLKSGVNIVAGDEVIGKVTIRLTDVPWEKALQIVLRTYGFTYEKDDNVIRVTTVESMKMEALVTEIFVLNFCTAADVNLSIQPMLTEGRGRTSVDVKTNSILVTDIPQNLDTIEMIIKRLDRITPQVMIEAKMIETTLDDDENLGINWTMGGTVTGSSRKVTFPFDKSKGGTRLFPGEFLPLNDPADALFPGGNLTEFPMAVATDFAFGTLDFTAMKLVMEILESRTNTKILSSPRIVTMDNQEAEIIVAKIWPFPKYEYNKETGAMVRSGFDYKPIGVILTVTPTINQQDYITMKINPKVSEIVVGETTYEGQPLILTREARTQVIVKDGHTIAIGG